MPPRIAPDTPATTVPSATPPSVRGQSISGSPRQLIDLLQAFRRPHIHPAPGMPFTADQPLLCRSAQQRRQRLRPLTEPVEQARGQDGNTAVGQGIGLLSGARVDRKSVV